MTSIFKVVVFICLIAFSLVSFAFWTWFFILAGAIKRSHSFVETYLIDIWFALVIPVAIDAIAIALNFNRSLIHQWHYWMSLRMVSIAFVIPFGYRLYLYDCSLLSTTVICLVILAFLVYLTRWIHLILPPRGSHVGFGNLSSFTESMSEDRLLWKNAILYATINGAAGFLLILYTPTYLAFIVPMLHIVFEIYFLGLMETKQTPKYIIFATPIVQAVPAIYWGIYQLMDAPELTISPLLCCLLMLLSRLILDMSLYYGSPGKDLDRVLLFQQKFW